jgi:ParB family chromosome partitioning protein
MSRRPKQPTTTRTIKNVKAKANNREKAEAKPEKDPEDRLPLKWKIKNIPLDKLEIDEQHFERKVDPTDVEKMAESIKELGGVIHPLTVRPIPKKPGRFAIISGRDRSEAAKLIGRKKLSCRILEDCSDDRARMISIYENVIRSSVSATEKKQGLAELVGLIRTDLGPMPFG